MRNGDIIVKGFRSRDSVPAQGREFFIYHRWWMWETVVSLSAEVCWHRHPPLPFTSPPMLRSLEMACNLVFSIENEGQWTLCCWRGQHWMSRHSRFSYSSCDLPDLGSLRGTYRESMKVASFATYNLVSLPPGRIKSYIRTLTDMASPAEDYGKRYTYRGSRSAWVWNRGCWSADWWRVTIQLLLQYPERWGRPNPLPGYSCQIQTALTPAWS